MGQLLFHNIVWIVTSTLPPEAQKDSLRKGQGNSNDIFKKGRAEHLPYKKDLRNIFETFAKPKAILEY